MIARDLLELYNNLIHVKVDIPVGVTYSKRNRCLVFTQYGWRMDTSVLNYYCKDLVKIKRTVLMPNDLKTLLDTMKSVIESGNLKNDRILVSPIKYGFEIYKSNPYNLTLGPIRLGSFKFVSNNGWIYRMVVNRLYGEVIGDIKK